jgi:prophage antirepressor-like protein
MEGIYDTFEKNYLKFGSDKIRAGIDQEGILWFCGFECADSMGYKDSNDALRAHVDADDKDFLNNIKGLNVAGRPRTIFITESGLYSLVLRSKLAIAQKFKKWVTKEVLPAIRSYEPYKLKQLLHIQQDKFLEQINDLKSSLETVKNDHKKDKYPNGGITYAIDFSTNTEEAYRIGSTDDTNSRKKIYDTHSFHKREVVHIEEIDYPQQLETCVRNMLADYKYQNKDVYVCSLSEIKKAFRMCSRDLHNMKKKKSGSKTKKQTGGGKSYMQKRIDFLKKKERSVARKIARLDKIIEQNNRHL